MSNTNGDYISREAAIAAVHEHFDEILVYDESGETAANEIEDILLGLTPFIPIISRTDVRPVKRGEWKKAYADHEAFGVRPFYRYCSECHESTVFPYSFCPHCGAKMGDDPDAIAKD